VVLDTSRYAVSAGTFPSYFLKRDDEVARAQMSFDARLFGQWLAPPFSIVRRVVGHEPYCPATASYNRTMKDVLPEHGVELVEIQRAGDATGFISATRVRERLAAGDLAAVQSMVPPPTLAFLQSPDGVEIAERLRRRVDEGLVPTV
jgi:[citrate (pro-3S)-lyase] ligase